MEAMRHPDKPPHGELPFITHELVERQLGVVSALDRLSLDDMLVAHEQLPPEDPARFVIEFHEREFADTDISIRTGYRLGVVFGRNLVMKALGSQSANDEQAKDLPLPPMVTNNEQANFVKGYLERAQNKRLKKLTRRDKELGADLTSAVQLFYGKVQNIMLDVLYTDPKAKEMIVRGVHDYLSVTALLLAPKEERQPTMRRALGLMTLGLGGFALSSAVSRKNNTENLH